MPELPDVITYVESLQRLLAGQTVESIRVRSPFVLQTFDPPIESMEGCIVNGFSRRGKRIVWHFESGLFLVVHPMIAGRFHWKKKSYSGRGKHDLLTLHFEDGVMALTEVSKQKRAKVWVLDSREAVDAMDPGGLDVMTCTLEAFSQILLRENRTLKRALCNPRAFDGIGNAFSDEILHAARLSPMKRTSQLSAVQIKSLYDATRTTMARWIQRLREQTGSGFPEKVTAFRPEMNVHGKFNEPCPDCGAPVQRIRYSSNECNYCPGCQTDGRILSDRSLARLLKDDWPKRLEDLDP
ncbi:MAG: DNA-formamidopyrimidine glycosylase family protein [Planctomycetota bacterium]